jgi:hypothetical protein
MVDEWYKEWKKFFVGSDEPDEPDEIIIEESEE